MSNKNPVYVVQHNHFDPIWRRCWDRTFDYRGKRYRSYADVEEHVINIWLENAKRGATFSEGQAVVFRKYLERNPERLSEMQGLVKKGLIELTAAGETVSDTNMPSGETLLRNLVMGQLYFEETFGVIPGVGWLEDAFGQSAQMPQLFRGVEVKHVLKRSYKVVPGLYWKGLDGSHVYTQDAPGGHSVGHCIKIAPCPGCDGVGCEKCDDTGFSDMTIIADEALAGAFSADWNWEPFSVFAIGGEEAVPNSRLPEMLVEAREKYGVDFKFGGFEAISEYYAKDIAKVDAPDVAVSDELEGNPASTGCYVSRIRIKQEMRRIENMVNAAERWATVSHLMGEEYPTHCLTEAWRNVIFCGFHDAITSTHIDAAYQELLDMLATAEHEAGHVFEDALETVDSHIAAVPGKNHLVIYNCESWDRQDPVTLVFTGTEGCPSLKGPSGEELEVLEAYAEGDDLNLTFIPPKTPALGYAAVEVIPDVRPLDQGEITHGSGELENEFYKISVGPKGIESIVDKRVGQSILDTNRYLGNELILEEDIGHPWGTMQAPSFEEGLADWTTDVKIRQTPNGGEINLTGQYKGSDANVKLLTWRQSVKLYKGVDRIDFHTQVDWDTAQRRIRVAFPTNIKTSDGMYSIPYGALKRWKYESDMHDMPSTNGDWPAVNWVDLYGEGENRGVALINNGTPSHKIEDGVIYMSVLRSPTDSWCLNEPEYYDCPDFDGARDAGTHDFYYSLISHAGDYRVGDIEKRAREVNNPLVARALTGSRQGKLGLTHSFMKIEAGDNVIVTAIKKAERDDSVIVRLAETAGESAEAKVSIEGAGQNVSTVNFLERNAAPVAGKTKLSPFKIVTLNLK